MCATRRTGQSNEVFSETDNVDMPVSPYAATKKACELLAYTYYHLYKFPIAGLRFFTVYGPNGRPDMAPFKFVDRVFRGAEIQHCRVGRCVLARSRLTCCRHA